MTSTLTVGTKNYVVIEEDEYRRLMGMDELPPLP